jgi:beta-lactamase class A
VSGAGTLIGLAALAVAANSIAGPGRAPRGREPVPELKRQLDRVAESFHGVLGYSLHHRGAPDERLNRRGGERFPSASTIKTAIMCEALHQVEQEKIRWNEPIPVQAGTERREAGGFAYFFKDESQLPLSEWVHLMITVSDNTATINLRDRLGQKNINNWLTANGFHDTLLLNGPETEALGLRPLQQQYGLGVTTPDEMVHLTELIADYRAGSRASCDRMLRLLTHQYWDNGILRQVPPRVRAASKSGALDDCRSDVGIVDAPSGQYVMAIYTRDQKDTRWRRDNEGNTAIREIASRVWQHYEPGDDWRPPAGSEELLPDE